MKTEEGARASETETERDAERRRWRVCEYMRVDTLTIGNEVRGINADGAEASCTVTAIGESGFGTVYGNYTSNHFVLDQAHGEVIKHGAIGKISADNLFYVLLDCPFGLDETGVAVSLIAP